MQQFPTVTTLTTHRREAAEVHRLERRSNKIVATENGLFNTISAGHSRYYHESLKLLNLRPAVYF